MVRVKDREAPGLNDGLIYPGEMFTLGTPVRKIRNAAMQRTPLHGVVRVIVVLAQFTDKAMTQSKQHFHDLFFSEGVLPNGSVQEYFKEVTNGLVNLQGEVVGPYTLPLKDHSVCQRSFRYRIEFTKCPSNGKRCSDRSQPSGEFCFL